MSCLKGFGDLVTHTLGDIHSSKSTWKRSSVFNTSNVHDVSLSPVF